MTMKTLFLIRHAKSSWEDASLSDKERPLKKRGVSDAQIMGKVLHKHGIKPIQIISSPAIRALHTAEIIAAQLGFDKKKIEKNKQLYFEGIENIFKVIQSLDAKTNTAFIFGHNPDFTQLVNLFSATGIENLPTCGIAGIEFNVKDWSEATAATGKLLFYDFPKRHR